MPFAQLAITDGTTRINLISDKQGFYLEDWTPSTAPAKNDGIWQDSPFVDGRRLAMKQYGNIIDTMTVGIQGDSPDDLIYFSQEMRRMLRKASQYWTTNWQNEPVWIEAKADCETNLRYAIIMDGRLGEDDNPYAEPMVGTGTQYAMPDLSLVLEHQYWTAQEPTTADCVYIRNHNRYPWVMWLCPSSAAGTTTLESSDAVFDDLPTGDFTAEIWVFGDLNFVGSGRLFDKTNWYAQVDPARTITCFAAHAVANATLTTVTALPVNPQGWTHIAVAFETAGNTFSVWINGVAAGGIPVAGVGAYVSDVAANLTIASGPAANLFITHEISGSRMTWSRISNSIRYGAPFTPHPYDELPSYDANTLCTTNGCYTFSGLSGASGNIAFFNSFAYYYRASITDTNGRLGVERYLENEGTYICDFANIVSANSDREGAGIDYCFSKNVATGVFGPNIIDTWPCNLFQAGFAAGDEVYIGSGFYQGAVQPDQFVMEVATLWTPASWVFTTRYWDGAWTAATQSFDNTTYSNKTLIFSITPQTVPLPTTINGYYGYWLKLTFTTLAANIPIVAGPALISNPAVLIENTYAGNTIEGDLEAIARLSLQGWAKEPTNIWNARRHLLSLYSYGERDVALTGYTPSWFTPYINLTKSLLLTTTKPRNQPGITADSTSVPAALTWLNSSPVGWTTVHTIPATTGQYVIARIESTTSVCYRGKYRVMGRLVAQSGATGDVTARVYIGTPYYSIVGVNTVNLTTEPDLLDFGIIDLPAVGEGKELNYEITVYMYNTTAAPILVNTYDLILWPIDEWTADYLFEVLYPPGGITYAAYPLGNFLYADPVLSPKHNRSVIQTTASTVLSIPIDPHLMPNSGGVTSSMSAKTPILQAQTAQKMYCLQGAYKPAIPRDVFYYRLIRSWSLEKVEQYESMRGNR